MGRCAARDGDQNPTGASVPFTPRGASSGGVTCLPVSLAIFSRDRPTDHWDSPPHPPVLACPSASPTAWNGIPSWRKPPAPVRIGDSILVASRTRRPQWPTINFPHPTWCPPFPLSAPLTPTIRACIQVRTSLFSPWLFLILSYLPQISLALCGRQHFTRLPHRPQPYPRLASVFGHPLRGCSTRPSSPGRP